MKRYNPDRFSTRDGLNDAEIVKALKAAEEQYENGEIIEVRDTLLGIIRAIDAFDKAEEERNNAAR